MDKLIPKEYTYEHHKRWGDYNGHSHIRATFIKSSLTIPLINGKPILGTWQQVILIEFDVRPRKRRVIITIMGE
jgi:secondary thiamine-phosphate synthase enzyme